jgi:hypothetical protein
MIERFFKPNSRFVHVVISQDLDDQQVKDHLLAYNREAAGKQALLELVDCQALEDISRLTVQGLFNMAKLEAGQSWSQEGRLAIWVRSQHQYGMARAYCTSAENTRSKAKVFYELDEALEWLGVEEPLREIHTFMENNLDGKDAS